MKVSGRPKSNKPRRVSIAVLVEADQAQALAQFDNRSEVVRQALALFLPSVTKKLDNSEQKLCLSEAAS